MQTIFAWLYVISGLYSIYIFTLICSRLFKKKPVKEIVSIISKQKYASIILTVALITCPINLYFVYLEGVPEGAYSINTMLSIDGDPNKYVAEAKIYYYEDIEYEEGDPGSDYLRKGSSFPETYLTSTFNLFDFNYHDYEIRDLPEIIESKEKYDIEILLPENNQDLDCIWTQATIEIPVLTYNTLGVTVSDQLRNISVMRYVEYIVIFVSALVGLVICILQEKNKVMHSNFYV